MLAAQLERCKDVVAQSVAVAGGQRPMAWPGTPRKFPPPPCPVQRCLHASPRTRPSLAAHADCAWLRLAATLRLMWGEGETAHASDMRPARAGCPCDCRPGGGAADQLRRCERAAGLPAGQQRLLPVRARVCVPDTEEVSSGLERVLLHAKDAHVMLAESASVQLPHLRMPGCASRPQWRWRAPQALPPTGRAWTI